MENHFPDYMKLTVPVRIFIFKSPSDADVTLEWNYMKSDTNNQIIRLNCPSSAYEHDSYYDDNWYKANLIHEYVHLIVAKFIENNTGKEMNRNYPRWFTEGIAGYIPYFHSDSAIFDKYKRRLQKAQNDIANAIDFDHISTEVYFCGAILVKYIYDQYGKKGIIEILRSTIFEWKSVILDVLEIPYETFKKNVIIWVRRNLSRV